MWQTTHFKPYFGASLFLLIIMYSHAQTDTESGDLQQTDVISFAAPSDTFKSIYLQTHKELPRFGTLNQYSPTVTKKSEYGSRGNPKYAQQNPSTKEKIRVLRNGYVLHRELVKMKYLKILYDDMDLNAISKPDYKNPEGKDSRSYVAQNHLRTLAKRFCTAETFNAAYGRSNQFEQQRNYQNFVEGHLKPLKKWSNTFFENDAMEAYIVTTSSLSSYDFEKEGYWLPVQLTNGARSIFFSALEPVSSVEENILNLVGTRAIKGIRLWGFLSIPTTNAEKLQEQNIQRLYLVRKVKVNYKDIEYRGNQEPNLKFSFHHLNPIIEIYEDEGLTKKLGELPLNVLGTTKEY